MIGSPLTEVIEGIIYLAFQSFACQCLIEMRDAVCRHQFGQAPAIDPEQFRRAPSAHIPLLEKRKYERFTSLAFGGVAMRSRDLANGKRKTEFDCQFIHSLNLRLNFSTPLPISEHIFSPAK